MAQSSSLASPTAMPPAAARARSSPTSSTPASARSARTQREEVLGDRRVDQQGLGRVADARALDLGVDGDPPRHLEVGVGVDVDVAVAGGRVDDRHRGDVLERRLQAFAAARDQQVDEPVLGGELGQPLVAAAGEQQHRVLGQAGLGQRLADDRRPAPRWSAPRSASRAARSRCRS